MKIAISLLFLLAIIKPSYACLQPIPAPEDSTPQQSTTPDTSLLLQRNVQLSTEFMQLFRMGLEEKLKSLQGLQKGVSKLENTAYSPELVCNVRDTDLAEYWNAVQETQKTLEQIAEYTEQVKMGMLAEHMVTIRELEQAKRKITNMRVPATKVALVGTPDWSGPRDC